MLENVFLGQMIAIAFFGWMAWCVVLGLTHRK